MTKSLKHYLISLPVMIAAALLSMAIEPFVDEGSVVLVYMLAVVVAAFFLSIGPAMLVGLFGVIVFDYFNLPPFMTFTRTPLEYAFTLGVMAITAATISTLASRLRQQAQDSEDRAGRTAALYALSDDLGGSVDTGQVVETLRRHVARAFSAVVELAPAGQPPADSVSWPFLPMDLARVREQGGLAVRVDPDLGRVCGRLRLPDSEPVMLMAAAGVRWLSTTEQQAHFQAMLTLAELALERLELRNRVQSTELKVQQESLRSSILNTLSHDLRTPLAAIIGASSSLLENGDALAAEDRLRLRGLIYEEARHMQGMVEDLLDLARLEGGSLALSREWQALEEIVGSAVSALRRHLATHRIEVSVPDDLPLIRCDSVLIKRVLTNLVENAAKYSLPGTRIRLSAHAAPGRVRVVVEDEGIGVPEPLRDVVFQPFVRHAPTAPGVGLGLTICRRIVEAHQGWIWIESGEGGGARLVLELPAPEEAPTLSGEPVEELT